jgi:hypothetical protein
MKRSDLEHILRESEGTTSETAFIVIGSQAILGAFPDAPRVLRQSMEADLYLTTLSRTPTDEELRFATAAFSANETKR